MICVYIKSHIAQQPLLNVFNGHVHDLNPPSSTIELQIKIKKKINMNIFSLVTYLIVM